MPTGGLLKPDLGVYSDALYDAGFGSRMTTRGWEVNLAIEAKTQSQSGTTSKSVIESYVRYGQWAFANRVPVVLYADFALGALSSTDRGRLTQVAETTGIPVWGVEVLDQDSAGFEAELIAAAEAQRSRWDRAAQWQHSELLDDPGLRLAVMCR